jgi:hypothetical protein
MFKALGLPHERYWCPEITMDIHPQHVAKDSRYNAVGEWVENTHPLFEWSPCRIPVWQLIVLYTRRAGLRSRRTKTSSLWNSVKKDISNPFINCLKISQDLMSDKWWRILTARVLVVKIFTLMLTSYGDFGGYNLSGASPNRLERVNRL